MEKGTADKRRWTQLGIHDMRVALGALGARHGMLLGIIALGSAVRLGALGAKSIWLDEAFSIWMASHPLPELIDWLVRIDQHPPLYYVLLRGWITLFGEGQAAVRLLSALGSTLALPFFYGAIRRLFDARVGWLAALLLALSPLQVHFAQEARMYALLTLEVAVLLYCLARLLVPPTAEPSARVHAARPAWAGVIGAQVAIMLTHNTAAVYVPLALQVAVVGPLLWQKMRRHRGGDPEPLSLPGLERPRFLRNWLLAQAAALLLWVPWAPAFVVQAAGVDRSFWMQPPTPGTVGALFQELQLAHLPATFPLFVVMHALFLGCAGIGVWALRRKSAHLWLLVSLLMVPIGVALLVSLRRPIFSTHTLLWLTLPYLVLVALGIQAVAARWPRLGRAPMMTVLVALLVLAQGGALHGYFAYFHKEAWDAAAHAVATRAQPGDLILFNATWVQLPFDYYFRRYPVEAELRGVPVDLFERGELEPIMTEADLPRLRALVAAQPRGGNIWLIYSHNWYTDPAELIPTELARRLGLAEIQPFNGVQVYRFKRCASR